MKYILVLVLSAFFCGFYAAETPKTTWQDSLHAIKNLKPEPQYVADPLSFMSIVKLFFMLALIIGLIFAATYVFKRVSFYGKLSNFDQSQILDVFPLSQKQAIYVVSMLDVIYILGISPNNVNLLDKISDSQQVKELQATVKAKRKIPYERFEKVLRRFKKV